MNSDFFTLSIHDVLGNLRRRVTEILSGDNLGSYKYARDIIAGIKANIESFSPQEIVKYLNPIFQDLTSISEEIFSLLPDETSDYDWLGGESPRESLRKEVANYILILKEYIEKYSPLVVSPKVNDSAMIKNKSTVIRYSNFNRPSGKQKLRNLRLDLYLNYGFIEKIEFREFKKIFSGEEQIIANPINWTSYKNALRYFLSLLFQRQSIAGESGDTRINWVAVKNCFRFKDSIIDPDKFKGNNSMPNNSSIINGILRDF